MFTAFAKKKNIHFLGLSLFLFSEFLSAQCPGTINLSSTNDKITIDNFNDFFSGVTHYGTTTILIDSPDPACIWDLYADATLTTVSTFSAQGAALSFNNIFIRATNNCGTPDQIYGAPPPPRITQTFNNNLTAIDNFYIVGTDIADGLLPSTGACAVNINNTGSSITNSNTHRFRIDIEVQPDMAPILTTPGIYDLVLNFYNEDDAVAGANVVATYQLRIEILPVLEMNINTASLLDFSFTTIPSYVGGQTQYGATSLSASSTVQFDLIAIGTSSDFENNGNAFWDVMGEYTAQGNNQIPLEVLELHQIPANPTGAIDYSSAFASPPAGANDITIGSQGGNLINIPVTSTVRTIAGNLGVIGAGNSIDPGSYLPISGALYSPADYKYKIDYRLLPMLPPTFNRAIAPVRSGIYRMEVRYIITEDQ